MKNFLQKHRRMLYVIVFLFHPFLTIALEPTGSRADSVTVQERVTPAPETKVLRDVAGSEVVAKHGKVRELYLEAPAGVLFLDAEGHVLEAGKGARMVVISGLKPGTYHLRDETGRLRKWKIR